MDDRHAALLLAGLALAGAGVRYALAPASATAPGDVRRAARRLARWRMLERAHSARRRRPTRGRRAAARRGGRPWRHSNGSPAGGWYPFYARGAGKTPKSERGTRNAAATSVPRALAILFRVPTSA